ncbi:MAG: hypothetical protein E2586_02840 [Novosphingobium sp.]|nr:hypothetical protein [Novosphingobium sp.]
MLRVHVPVTQETLAAMLAGDGEAAERDPVLASILATIREDNQLGNFGFYKGVVEMGLGWESFVPGQDATPTVGESGKISLSPTVVVKVHAPCRADDPTFRQAVDRIMAIHPWETPVIEIAPLRLVCREIRR